MPRPRLTRRQLLGSTAALGATTVLGGLALSTGGCATGPLRTVGERGLDALPGGVTGQVATSFGAESEARALCEAVTSKVTDFAWLKPGDTVFLKLAVNSGGAHPATTWPGAVTALVQVLKDRGAGKVIVGDQSGVGHVRLTAAGRVSTTRAQLESSGLADAIRGAGAQLHAFDDAGWDGYFQATSDFADHWAGRLYLPRVLREVDHVVYLPRLSTHVLAGYTAAIKLAVGWMRDDSRGELHRRGDRFFELFSEANHFPDLRARTRLALTLSTKALLNVGPDFGDVHELGGCLAFASANLVDHDLFASSLLPFFDAGSTSLYDLYSPYPQHANYWNEGFVSDTWGDAVASAYEPLAVPPPSAPLALDAACARLALLQGRRPDRVALVGSPERLPPGLLAHLKGVPGGLFVA